MKPTVSSLGSNIEQPIALLRAVQSGLVCGALTLAAIFSFTGIAVADEGGVSFWLPGQFGSLAAVPQEPGWSYGSVFYYTNPTASGAAAASREAEIGRFNPSVNLNLNAKLYSNAALLFLSPTYVFANPVFGGQLALGVVGAFGYNSTSINGTLT